MRRIVNASIIFIMFIIFHRIYQYCNNYHFCYNSLERIIFSESAQKVKRGQTERERMREERREERFNEERKGEQTMNRREPSMYAYSMERAQN